MSLKTININGRNFAEVRDGKPVYITPDGETVYDGEALAERIKSLNSEAAKYRRRLREAERYIGALEAERGTDSA